MKTKRKNCSKEYQTYFGEITLTAPLRIIRLLENLPLKPLCNEKLRFPTKYLEECKEME